MAITRWEEEPKATKKVPLLAEWLNVNQTEDDAVFQVTKVTLSKSSEHYLLYCAEGSSSGFMVCAFANSKAHEKLEKEFKAIRKNQIPLYVVVTDSELGKWTLGPDPDMKATWTKEGAGFKCNKAIPITPPAQK